MRRLAGLSILICGFLAAESPTPGQLEAIFAAYHHPDTPGCAVAVDSDGRDVFTAAYGMADLEHSVPNTAATVFEAGSVSKQFTAAAVLLLAERGRLSLNDDVRKYFSELPAYGRTITVRHLLNHTSGLRDWGEIADIAGWPRTTREYTHAHVLDILRRQHSLNYSPGDAWSYTNSGYNLAAMLVERLTGMSLQAFCRKEFFEPLGMNSTEWRDDFRRIVPRRAIAYSLRASEWRQLMPFENVYGNGGLLTTVEDLLKWNHNLSTSRLHPDVFKQMQQRAVLNDGTPVAYGLGFFLDDYSGLPEVSHGGATAGYRAWLGRVPSKGLSLAILCNAASANTTLMAHAIERLYLSLPEPQPLVIAGVTPGLYRHLRDNTVVDVGRVAAGGITFDGHPVQGLAIRVDGPKMSLNPQYGEDIWERAVPWHPTDLTPFPGTYRSEEADTVLRVVLDGGNVVIRRGPGDSIALKPATADSFQGSLGSVRFLKDRTGQVTGLSLGRSRVWDLRFVRVNSH